MTAWAKALYDLSSANDVDARECHSPPWRRRCCPRLSSLLDLVPPGENLDTFYVVQWCHNGGSRLGFMIILTDNVKP
jgi:hypothetical protein